MGVSVPDEESVRKNSIFWAQKSQKITFKGHKLVLNHLI